MEKSVSIQDQYMEAARKKRVLASLYSALSQGLPVELLIQVPEENGPKIALYSTVDVGGKENCEYISSVLSDLNESLTEKMATLDKAIDEQTRANISRRLSGTHRQETKEKGQGQTTLEKPAIRRFNPFDRRFFDRRFWDWF